MILDNWKRFGDTAADNVFEFAANNSNFIWEPSISSLVKIDHLARKANLDTVINLSLNKNRFVTLPDNIQPYDVQNRTIICNEQKKIVSQIYDHLACGSGRNALICLDPYLSIILVGSTFILSHILRNYSFICLQCNIYHDRENNREARIFPDQSMLTEHALRSILHWSGIRYLRALGINKTCYSEGNLDGQFSIIGDRSGGEVFTKSVAHDSVFLATNDFRIIQ